MSKRRLYIPIIVTLLVLLNSDYSVTALGLGLCAFVFIDFVEKIGYTIPVLEAMLLIACIQWIVGPYIDYISEYQHYRYYMYVSEERYMNLVVPSLFFLSLPIYYFTRSINYAFFIDRIQRLKIADQFSITLVVAGFLSEIIGRFAPSSLGFVFYLASGMRFIGLLYLFYSNSKKKWIVFAIVFGMQFIVAISGGLFHNLLLWSVLMLIFISIFYKISFIRKLLLISIGFSCIYILQSMKAGFRDEIWKNAYKGNKVELFLSIFLNKAGEIFVIADNAGYGNEDELGKVNNRLNQGWIISKIMDNIPAHAPFLGGETVIEAVYSSMFPRFLAESKLGGGGKYAFEKLTGLHLLQGTSMGVSIIGEVYGNYGIEGSYLFMFLWGIALSLFVRTIFIKSNYWYTLPLWLPIIFLQVIKAESDLLTVMNHLVKSTIFVFGLFIFFRVFLRVKM